MPGDLALKMAEILWWISVVSVSHETKHEKSSKHSGNNSEHSSEKHLGQQFRKIRVPLLT